MNSLPRPLSCGPPREGLQVTNQNSRTQCPVSTPGLLYVHPRLRRDRGWVVLDKDDSVSRAQGRSSYGVMFSPVGHSGFDTQEGRVSTSEDQEGQVYVEWLVFGKNRSRHNGPLCRS